ncbi:hypothetical protein QC762_0005680 [Podospora pseudocomata]|uniref:Uncharacterized protein n=1 Tax=Podospora pseudocomata TaxID=2093779 RepID=A0ABR0GTN6_9PEZI|nr:hypothetical protein QC762_0005680 [Podospora pseudocomata]
MDELASVIQSQATAQAQERTPTVPPLGLADSATVRTRENAATKYGETVNVVDTNRRPADSGKSGTFLISLKASTE